MIDWIAAGLRSMNAKQVGENRWIVQKFLKIFYGISSACYRIFGSPKKSKVIVINNFDGDLKIKLDISRSMGASIYWTNFHEFHEFLFLHKFLSAEMVFLDIGANLGEYTLFAAKRTSKGKVLAFEPLPRMYSQLQENVDLNQFRNVVISKYGLAETTGVLPIHEIENVHEGLSTFYPGDRKIKEKIEVPLKSFDQELKTFGVNRIDFMKLDIEGGELGALRGARNAISRFRPVVMVEINEPTYQAAGYSSLDVYQFFESLNYRPFEIDKQGNLYESNGIASFENIVFKPS